MSQALPYVSGFRELTVYQKARQLAQEIFQLTKTFPKEGMYSLTDQVRRSSRSIGAQIAEAWAKRRYEAHFISKLTDSDGEQQETQHWVLMATDCGYVSSRIGDDLLQKCEEIGRLLQGMIAKSDKFCGVAPKTLRETPVEYIASTRPTDY
jgi:four helix bundle protein